MEIEDAILLNKYGQGLIDSDELRHGFSNLDLDVKRRYLTDLVYMITQSKANNSDIETAIAASGLKNTFTPSVLLSKGTEIHHLNKIVSLPEAELIKTLILFLNLFKIAYRRRYDMEKNDPNKWWYWDLSDDKNVRLIKRRY